MLRMVLIAVLAVLVAAPVALADPTRNQILRECQSGRLTGDYTAREIRDARENIPDDIDQYTDCRDVLSRALQDRAGGSGGSGGAGGAGTGGFGGGGSGGGFGGGGTGGELLTPSTDADRQALEEAATAGGQPVEVAGRPVTPGAGRNDLPGTLFVLLVLLAAAAVAAALPSLRRYAGVPLAVLRRRVLAGRSG